MFLAPLRCWGVIAPPPAPAVESLLSNPQLRPPSTLSFCFPESGVRAEQGSAGGRPRGLGAALGFSTVDSRLGASRSAWGSSPALGCPGHALHPIPSSSAATKGSTTWERGH